MINNLNFLKHHVLTAALITVSAVSTTASLVKAETIVNSTQERATTSIVEKSINTNRVESTTVSEASEASIVTHAATDITPITQTEISTPESLAQPSKIAQDLLAQEPAPIPPEPTTEPTTPSDVFRDPDPGRATRSGSSYVGLGGNIGLTGGGSAVGDGSFVILSKIGLTYYLSVRPSIFFGDDVSILLPLTYDFGTKAELVEGYPIRPYVGAGVAFTFDDDFIDALFTAGIDVPISQRFTATAAANVTPFNDFSFGIMIGVGYNIGF